MAHRMVKELQFARAKLLTGYEGLSNEDAMKRLGNANSASWMIGHLACFEQLTWCELAQGRVVDRSLKAYDFGQPATTPPLDEVLTKWKAVMPVCDVYLETLTDADMGTFLKWPNGKNFWDDIGTTILRHTWHYWYHLGEMQGLRQAMGHEDLPAFIGNMRSLGGFASED